MGIIVQINCKQVETLQEIMTFFTKDFNQKSLPYGFFTPMSNLTNMSFWTSQFRLNHFD
jgi:hypothetical protein